MKLFNAVCLVEVMLTCLLSVSESQSLTSPLPEKAQPFCLQCLQPAGSKQCEDRCPPHYYVSDKDTASCETTPTSTSISTAATTATTATTEAATTATTEVATTAVTTGVSHSNSSNVTDDGHTQAWNKTVGPTDQATSNTSSAVFIPAAPPTHTNTSTRNATSVSPGGPNFNTTVNQNTTMDPSRGPNSNITEDPNLNNTDTEASTASSGSVVHSSSALISSESTTSIAVTTATRLVRCMPCHESCSSCKGGGASDCKTCHADHHLDTDNGTGQCVPTDNTPDSGPNIAVVAGASASGGVVLLVVVVVVVLLRRRRCRRNSAADMRTPRVEMRDITRSSEQSVKEDPEDGKDPQKMGSKVSLVTEEAYENVQARMPRPVSIERAHDKVTRYTRDPTAKKPVPDFEKEEVDSLPMAPEPPGPPGGRPITHPGRQHRTVASTEAAQQRKRKTDPPKATALPSSSAAARETSREARFPSEDAAAAVEQKQKKKRKVRPPPVAEPNDPDNEYEDIDATNVLQPQRLPHIGGIDNSVRPVDEEPKELYENQTVHGISNPVCQENEQPGELYENQEVHVTSNPVCHVAEEPEELYENQEFITTTAGRSQYRDVPGEEVPGEDNVDEHPYANVQFKRT